MHAVTVDIGDRTSRDVERRRAAPPTHHVVQRQARPSDRT